MLIKGGVFKKIKMVFDILLEDGDWVGLFFVIMILGYMLGFMLFFDVRNKVFIVGDVF